MNQFTWCAEVRMGTTCHILFGRVEAQDGRDAKEALVKEFDNREYHVQRLSIYGYRKNEPLQVDVLS